MSKPRFTRNGVITFDDADGERRRAHGTWYRGDGCNFAPDQDQLAQADAWERFILPGWAPAAPVINSDDQVMAVGSCFARSVSRYLRANRADLRVNADAAPGTPEAAGVALFFFGGGFVNTFTILQQFEWALGHSEIAGGTLFAEHPGSFLKRRKAPAGKRIVELPTSDEVRERTRQAILDADAFIFTLGLSEVWFDKESGEVFFKAVPTEEFDSTRHEFRLTTLEENLANIERLREIIRREKPDAPIIFTLSPVPLTATFRPVSRIMRLFDKTFLAPAPRAGRSPRRRARARREQG
jgi:hypothetical protein